MWALPPERWPGLGVHLGRASTGRAGRLGAAQPWAARALRAVYAGVDILPIEGGAILRLRSMASPTGGAFA